MVSALETQLEDQSGHYRRIRGGPRASELARGSAPAETFDPYRALTDVERAEQLEALFAAIVERDGEIDFEAETLSRREAYLRQLGASPVTWRGPMDAEGFRKYLETGVRKGLDPWTAWLGVLAKSNESEAHGVESEVRKYRARGWSNVSERELYVLLEERYHTRILVEACRTCGIDLTMTRPSWVMRLLMAMMSYLPDSIRYIPILCGEVIATVAFRRLRDTTDLFSEDPAVQARLRSLLSEILIDETHHVIHCRALLGPIAIRAARLLAPLIHVGIMWGIPQVTHLGWSRRRLLRELSSGVEVPSGMARVVRDRVSASIASSNQPQPS